MGKLSNIRRLEKKEKGLENNRVILSKRISRYRDVMPLTEEIAALQIGIEELIALKVGINEAVKHYNLPPLAATLRLINDIKKYNKINQLNRELSSLYLQKYTLHEACSRHNQALITLGKLQSYGITEQQIISMKNFLANNEYNIDMNSRS